MLLYFEQCKPKSDNLWMNMTCLLVSISFLVYYRRVQPWYWLLALVPKFSCPFVITNRTYSPLHLSLSLSLSLPPSLHLSPTLPPPPLYTSPSTPPLLQSICLSLTPSPSLPPSISSPLPLPHLPLSLFSLPLFLPPSLHPFHSLPLSSNYLPIPQLTSLHNPPSFPPLVPTLRTI